MYDAVWILGTFSAISRLNCALSVYARARARMGVSGTGPNALARRITNRHQINEHFKTISDARIAQRVERFSGNLNRRIRIPEMTVFVGFIPEETSLCVISLTLSLFRLIDRSIHPSIGSLPPEFESWHGHI